jgi:hypothetical protein
MDKYRIVMEFNIMADSPKDARNKVRILNHLNKSWLLNCSILKLSVRMGSPRVHGGYKDITEK